MLLSLARNQPPKKGVAMTGELTLTGHVLPIGGVREKVIASGLALAHLERASPRNEDNEPVQGLVVVAAKT